MFKRYLTPYTFRSRMMIALYVSAAFAAVISLLLDWSVAGQILMGIAVVLTLSAFAYYMTNLLRMMRGQVPAQAEKES